MKLTPPSRMRGMRPCWWWTGNQWRPAWADRQLERGKRKGWWYIYVRALRQGKRGVWKFHYVKKVAKERSLRWIE